MVVLTEQGRKDLECAMQSPLRRFVSKIPLVSRLADALDRRRTERAEKHFEARFRDNFDETKLSPEQRQEAERLKKQGPLRVG